MPIKLIAYDDTQDDRLVAVVRLRHDDNEEDEAGKKIFPEGAYRLSGLCVDKPYGYRGIGQTVV